MYTFNGIGTTLYGRRERQPDGSHVATKWVVLFFFPVLPLRSYRVWPQGTEYKFLRTVEYYRLEPQRLSWRQVLNWYLLTGCLGPIMLYAFGGGLLIWAWQSWR